MHVAGCAHAGSWSVCDAKECAVRLISIVLNASTRETVVACVATRESDTMQARHECSSLSYASYDCCTHSVSGQCVYGGMANVLAQ